MARAEGVFELPVREGSGMADVRLVTDGEMWQAQR